jgi:pilin isopeptide linkage protein
MRKWLNVFLALVMTVICSTTMILPAYAAELPGVSVPVTISLSGTLPKPEEDFTIKLRADNASYPMPEDSVGDIYTMTITGADTKNFPTITYNRVGVYTYTIYQVAGNNKKCTYDDTVYALTVYITNAEDGSGLEATAVLYPDSEGNKLPGAEFDNEYETVKPTPTDPDTPKTGDESTPVLYAVLIAVSLGVIVCLFLTRKSQKAEE